MTESQSWVTSRAQEMFPKSVPENWNPDRPYPDEHHDSRHNPQVIPETLMQDQKSISKALVVSTLCLPQAALHFLVLTLTFSRY